MDDETRDYLAERNAHNLNAGMTKARTIVNAVNRRDRPRSEEAVLSFLNDFWRDLTEDEREQAAMNAFTTVVQLGDQVNHLKRVLGSAKIK